MIEKEKIDEIKQIKNVVESPHHIKSYLTQDREEELIRKRFNGSTKFVLASLSTTDFCQNLTPNERRVFVNKNMEGSYFVQGKKYTILLFAAEYCLLAYIFCCCFYFHVQEAS